MDPEHRLLAVGAEGKKNGYLDEGLQPGRDHQETVEAGTA
jgi:hypothetical protein